MKDDILNDLMEFLRTNMQIDPADQYFTPDVDLFDYGYLDSFGIVSFILMVKEKWGVDMDNVDFYSGGFRTVRGQADYIAEHAGRA